MKKMAIFTAVGILSGIAGIIIGYYFLKSLDGQANFIYLVISLISILASIFCLYKATNPKKHDSSLAEGESAVDKTVANNISQNASVLNKWNEITETRDKLKLLKMTGKLQDEITSE